MLHGEGTALNLKCRKRTGVYMVGSPKATGFTLKHLESAERPGSQGQPVPERTGAVPQSGGRRPGLGTDMRAKGQDWAGTGHRVPARGGRLEL
eukprot:5527984-Prymnesium_polylepis.1